MLEVLQEAIFANRADAAAYPQSVQIWMTIMALGLFSSVLFVGWKHGARWILAAAVVNAVGLIAIRAKFPELSRAAIGTGIHLTFWNLALYIIWRPGQKSRRLADFQGRFGGLYRSWLIAVSLIMATSLVLDAGTALSALIHSLT